MIEEAPGEQLLLAHVDVLSELPQSELEYLAKRCRILHLAKKESLTLGKYQRGVLLLLSGRVRVHEPTFGTQDLTFAPSRTETLVASPPPSLDPRASKRS
jgi:hypothetical protein